MSEAISALLIGAALLAIALVGWSALGLRIQPSPMPIRLRDVADDDGCGILALTADPTLHPSVARELRIAILVTTALRTAGDERTATEILRRTQAVASARSPEAADELGLMTRRIFRNL